jgi:hypothetical protein
VLDAQVAAHLAEGVRSVATAIVGHDARDGDPKASIISHSRLEKRHRAVHRLVGFDLRESDAGMVVNADVDELPADASAPVWTT